MKQVILVTVLAATIIGCTSPAGSVGSGGSASTASFKGAKVRVLNLTEAPIDATLNGSMLGEAIPVEGASFFRLTPFKNPGKVTVGSHEFSVPLKGSTAFTVVCRGNGEPTIISGEPTEIAGGKSIVYFHSLIDGETAQIVTIMTRIGKETDVAHAESKVVSPGSYSAKVSLAGGKEASVTVDLEAGNAVTLFLLGTASAPRLIVLANDVRMIIGNSGGMSPTG